MGRPIFDDIKNISVQNNYRIPISVNIKAVSYTHLALPEPLL